MKKTIALSLFLCLAMTFTAFAQNGAEVNPRGIDFEDAPDGLRVTYFLPDGSGGVWLGLVTSVVTPSGNASLNWTGKLAEGDGLNNKKPEFLEFGVVGLYGALYDVTIKFTPSQVAILHAVQVDP